MMEIGVQLTVMSPVLLAASPPAQNLTETLEFIPGNTIRGLLARRYIERGGNPDDEAFKRLFLIGRTRFGFASIEAADVIPLSARSCKYEPGFRKDDGHGVTDILLEQSEVRCPDDQCGRPLDYLEGYYSPEICSLKRVAKRLITRTAIDPVQGSAAQGSLYSQRVIEEGQTFLAAIQPEEGLESVLRDLIAEPFTAGIGGGRSRGQGWVRVSAGKLPKFPLVETAEARFEKCSRLWGSAVLAVTLLSDGIFQDQFLRDVTAPLVRHLVGLGIDPADWEQEHFRAFAATRMVFGFDGEPLRLPRVPRLAVSAGSAFLFRLRADASPQIPKGDGIGWIGDNSREGYGRAVLWHPFHIACSREGDTR